MDPPQNMEFLATEMDQNRIPSDWNGPPKNMEFLATEMDRHIIPSDWNPPN